MGWRQVGVEDDDEDGFVGSLSKEMGLKEKRLLLLVGVLMSGDLGKREIGILNVSIRKEHEEIEVVYIIAG